jgi:1-phosphatidylinositol-3-phosphate 5-kinase
LIYSLTRFTKWKSNSGGKSKALFFKSQDNKLLFKSVSKQEFKMFIDTAGQYFHHNARYLFHKMPSALAKVLGAFKIKIRHQTKEKYYLLLMENVFYGIDKKNPFTKTYDLKGSLINRYITKTQMKKQEVLLDSNFKEDFNGEPIVLDRSVYELLNLAVHNDTFFLSSINVIDYSLLVVMSDIGELDSRLLKVGIIDYSRQYTWDKKLEHVVKLIINGLNNPTIISPNNYRDRFNSAIASYFIGV